MPRKAPSPRRPWEIKGQGKQEGRKFITDFYHSTAWRKFRHAFIAGFSTHLGTDEPHPNQLCIECAREGKTKETHTVDHIRPINREDPFDTKGGIFGEPLDWENCQPLCEHHNAVKTAKERHKELY